MPGISPNPIITAVPIISALGWERSCAPTSRPTFEGPSPVVTRVTIIPAATEMNRAGICAISPSPMVRME
jgi:hypothetical protein